MASLIIPGTRSITITNKALNSNKRIPSIFVQDSFRTISKSYIFFNIDSIPSNILITSAELVLFKNCSNINVNSFINVYPLKDDFSTCTTYRIQPRAYDSYKKVGEVSTNKVSVEVDIIDILKAWLDGTIINKGLSIEGNSGVTPFISFGSTLTRNEYIIPVLKVVYSNHFNNNPTVYLPVTINYADYENPGKYDNRCRLIIAVVVTVGSNQYHVSKEYAYIPSVGIDVINVAYVPQEGIAPTVEIGCSYQHL